MGFITDSTCDGTVKVFTDSPAKMLACVCRYVYVRDEKDGGLWFGISLFEMILDLLNYVL